MTDTQIALRLPKDLLDRAEALVPELEADAELGSLGRVTRSTVLRLAVARGLAGLEDHYGVPQEGRRRRGGRRRK